jgi:hypothetical protein
LTRYFTLRVETISTSAFLAWHKDKKLASVYFGMAAGDLVVQHSIDELMIPQPDILWNGMAHLIFDGY